MSEVLELNLNSLLHNFINDPENADNNFKLAIYYDSLGQTASAVSYYLRTAERTKFDEIKYQSLLRAAMCFDIQGCRNTTVKGLLQHSLAILPKRPEAYFLLSRFYERQGNHHDSYLIASLGEKIADKNADPLKLYVDYPGFYGILFEKAVSAWWCGLCDESRDILFDLRDNYELDEVHKSAVAKNIKKLSLTSKNLHSIYKSKEENGFDWGHAAENEWFKNTVENEIFVDKVYEKFFEVEEGDVVFDVGASSGPFTYSIKGKNPQKVYCFEPHSELFKNLTKNVQGDNVVCTNKAIGPIDGEFETSGLFNKDLTETAAEINRQKVPSVKFSTFIQENNIGRIDFLKSDCEGGEYDIFNDENLPWIKKNVRKIAGEWHLTTPEQKQKFRHFRDTYLRDFLNHEVYSIDYVDIKWSVWDDWFIEKYETINLYIDNRENNTFDWGEVFDNKFFRGVVEDEIFNKKIYERFFEVEHGDIVFDVGASVGPFTYSIKDKNPEKIYCFEPHKSIFNTLKKNITTDKAVFINKAIGKEDGHLTLCGIYNQDNILPSEIKVQESLGVNQVQKVESIKFSTFIQQNNIKQIDFIKTDCEGGEYDIFNDENLPWIKKNVKKIVGEWHLVTPSLKEKFRHFRDTYLRDLPNHEVYSYDGVDIKWSLWDDWFIEKYSLINLYIDNRESQPKKKWKNSVLPTMEFTTSIDTKNGCVVDCVFCPQRTLQKSYKGERFLTLDNFKMVVDKIPEEIRITFAGFTEPWLNPKCTDMLLYAYEKNHPISVFTTGIGMDVEDVERILHVPYAGNPNGGFVLHLPDQERKAKHPITDRYVKVIEKFGEVHSQIQNFTLMCMGTVHESVRHIFPEAATYQMWSRAGNLLGESIMKPELLNRKDEYKSVYHGEQPMTCGCLEKLYHNVMLPNGDVSLCCMDYGLEHILGNLFEQSYEEVIPEDNTCFNLCKFCENAKKPL